MGGEKYKRQQWKQKFTEKMKNANPNYGTNKCFKCGEEGHWANKCKGNGWANKKVRDLRSTTIDNMHICYVSVSESVCLNPHLIIRFCLHNLFIP